MGLQRRTPSARRSAVRGLITLLWRSPLIAIGFGLLFGLLLGRKPGDLAGLMLVSAVFTYTIALTMWVGEHTLFPRVVRPLPDGSRPVAHTITFFSSLSIAGAFLAAFVSEAFFGLRLLGSLRSLGVFLAFILIFTTLFMGIVMANRYYLDAMKRAREDGELQLARRIQQSFLPDVFPTGPGFEVHAVNISSRQVSGDFYDVMPAGEHGLLLAIADVSGKGFPAALLGSMLQASLRTQAADKESTAAITGTVNALATGAGSTGKFVTMFLAHLDKRTLALRYTNAGHNPPLLLRSSGARETLEEGGTVVGAFEGLGYAEGSVTLRPGDRLVFFTDGVTEAENAAGEMFGDERLISLLAGLPPDLSARGIVDRTLGGLNAFLGEVEPGDDITVMALRIPE
ncbi:MAG: PP2C family protein-serine/threonine phosphatase [Candidatus Eisenbacteria bacterium]|nr:PP2C family protein-serine/threonine phosphatase [Candidatus Eisenbacteria bacterium]